MPNSPITTVNSELLGIAQGDLIIRTAIIESIRDLRRNPWLLQFIFASLPQDSLTSNTYGQREIDKAYNWFVSHEIPVFLNVRLDGVQIPCISIVLKESVETEVTLGDINYTPSTPDNSLSSVVNPVVAGPFTPVSFTPVTTDVPPFGELVIPQNIGNSISITPGMFIRDSNGLIFPIQDMADQFTLFLEPNINANFNQVSILVAPPSAMLTVESVKYKETYQLGCHVEGEPSELIYLHSILVFCLLRYKQIYFESRGFERSVFSSSDLMHNDAFENENVFSRFVNLTGYVQQSWPKDITQAIQGVDTQGIKIIGSGHLDQGIDVNTQSWIGDQDVLSPGSPSNIVVKGD